MGSFHGGLMPSEVRKLKQRLRRLVAGDAIVLP